MAIKHTQQHSSCLQACSRTSPVLYRSICWQLITLKTHHRGHILPIKLWHLKQQHAEMFELKLKNNKGEMCFLYG